MSPSIASLSRQRLSQARPQPSQAIDDLEDEDSSAYSEIIRTGEASRLRRRGAIPSSHRNRQSTSGAVVTGAAEGRVQSQSTTGTSSSSRSSRNLMAPPQTFIPQAPWTDNVRGPPTPVPMYPPYGDGSTTTMDPIKWEDEPDCRHGTGYSLYCGFEEWDTDEIEPYEPSPFPSGWSDDANDSYEYSTSTCSSSRRRRRSTGCGALIHTNGAPKTRSGTWHAEGQANDTVVFLDKIYFERGGQAKQFACGCRWSGVGCANCGNTLGNIYIPCQAATSPSSSSSTRPSSTVSRGQAVSSINPYVSARPSRQHSQKTSALCIYTFFCDAVSASPDFTFPPCSIVKGGHIRASSASTNNTPGIDVGLVLPPPPPMQPQLAVLPSYSQPSVSSSRRGPPSSTSPAPRPWSSASLPSRLTTSNATAAANPIPSNPNSNFRAALAESATQFQFRPTPPPQVQTSPYRTNANSNYTTVNIDAFSYEAADAVNGVVNDAENESDEGRNPGSEPGVILDEDGVLLGSRNDAARRLEAVGASGLGEPASPDKPAGEVMWMAR